MNQVCESEGEYKPGYEDVDEFVMTEVNSFSNSASMIQHEDRMNQICKET
jgi:hypothetical protein